MHDAGSNRAQLAKLALQLQRNGFGVLAVDLRGHGGSAARDLDWSKLDDDKKAQTWPYARRDLEAASQWLSKRDEIHSTNINLVGISVGCTLTVAQASRDQNVNAVVLISPREAPELGYELHEEILELEGLPSMVFTRKKDDSTRHMVEEANNLSGDPYIDLVFGGSKSAELSDDKRMVKSVTDWLEKQATPSKGT